MRRPPPRRRARGGVAKTRGLPPVGVADVVERDADGDLFVKMAGAAEDGALIRLAPSPTEAAAGAPGLGDKVLVRLAALETGEFEARLIKRLGQSAHRILGVVRKGGRESRVEPVDRRSRESLLIHAGDARDLRDGDLVLAQVSPQPNRAYGPKHGKVLETVGRIDEPRAASLIAIHAHGLPTGFSPEAEAEAMVAGPPDRAGREDLTALPLVTIDPPDARDHDDAVHAEADADPSNRGGWIVWVAIADVAAYVRPGSALDRDARNKANSTYFPDRVEPMLPEHLSAGLCSLGEGEARACLAVRMVFDANGAKRAHRFHRGLMRSAASLSYEEAQAAIDGAPGARAGSLLENVIRPLWAAYGALKKGRDRRQPLAIESIERQIVLGPDGKVASIKPRQSLEAHRLIEEYMIQANVCAAETLGQRRSPLIYRVHETPTLEKMHALAEFLETLALPWAKGEAPRTERFNRLLEAVRGGPHAEMVNEVVLRTQMQAHYSTENIGHFGLNLARYAHFTSPIRRYADLVVHRGLIGALGLGADGLSGEDIARMRDTADHITLCERRSMAAERDANDRYVAAFLESEVGAEFSGRITGVTRFGLFVRLAETGADGLIPVSSLGGEYFVHEEADHTLVGQRTGGVWRLGRTVEVRLREANAITGGLLLEMLSEPEPPAPGAKRPKAVAGGRGGDFRPRGRPPSRRR